MKRPPQELRIVAPAAPPRRETGAPLKRADDGDAHDPADELPPVERRGPH